MDALANVLLRDRAALVDDVLVIADLHVGRAHSSNIELPVGDGADMVERFEHLCAHFDPREVVVAGDLLHSFESVPRMVDETVSGLRTVARDAGARMVVTPGNHDTMLDAIWSGPTTREHRVGETVICHGDVEPEAEAERYIIGHDHPTITIEGQRHPCYLAGDGVFRDSDVVMIPAFNRLVRGVSINSMSADDFMSPLVGDADAFAPVVRDEDDDETLTFPLLGEFRHQLS